MASKSIKSLRCAIYTRKSTEHGLELEFNSLDAQREACEAYIKSQASEGWQALPQRYDDPAFSGGNLDRPALKQLLKDIDAGVVDVVVVYKIDRLTRSLTDFARLVEVFDARSVSFVAITQQFNTTTSMGRLTLNILLSFAQFERELSSERVRDKVAASRRKGKWTGGSIPLGYDTINKKLVINEAEARTVRLIFSRYLVLRSFQKLLDELERKSIVTKVRQIKSGAFGGVPFGYGTLAYLLRNRVYLGEIGHKGQWFAGEHKAIVERALFNKVQQLLKENSEGRAGRRHQTGALLTGLIFDDKGNRMSPSFSVKRGVRYRSYVSSAVIKGRKHKAGSRTRIPAVKLEAAVLAQLNVENTDDQRAFLEQQIERLIVSSKTIAINLKADPRQPIELPWEQNDSSAPIEGERTPVTETQLAKAVVRAHLWVRQINEGKFGTIEELAKAAGLHPKVVRNRIRLAFLAPDITEAILQQRSPLTLATLYGKIPLGWNQQRALFVATRSAPELNGRGVKH